MLIFELMYTHQALLLRIEYGFRLSGSYIYTYVLYSGFVLEFG